MNTAPESPAKEQPREQNAAPQASGTSEHISASANPAVAAPDVATVLAQLDGIAKHLRAAYPNLVGDAYWLDQAAALIEKLGQGWIPPKNWVLVERSALQVAITMLEYAEDDPDDHAQASALSTYFDQLLSGVIIQPPPERP